MTQSYQPSDVVAAERVGRWWRATSSFSATPQPGAWASSTATLSNACPPAQVTKSSQLRRDSCLRARLHNNTLLSQLKSTTLRCPTQPLNSGRRPLVLNIQRDLINVTNKSCTTYKSHNWYPETFSAPRQRLDHICLHPAASAISMVRDFHHNV